VTRCNKVGVNWRLPDHLIGASEHWSRHGEAERLGIRGTSDFGYKTEAAGPLLGVNALSHSERTKSESTFGEGIASNGITLKTTDCLASGRSRSSYARRKVLC
jgi:hypothetical protein